MHSGKRQDPESLNLQHCTAALILFSFRVSPRTLQLAAFAGICVLLSGCAQTGPPLPPSLELPRTVTDLRAVRKGNRVTLTWSQPTLTTDRQSVRYFGFTRICRTFEAEMKDCGFPIAQLAPPPSTRQRSATTAASRTYIDTLPPELEKQHVTGEVTYAVEIPNRDGRSAGLSNRVQVAAAPAFPPPGNFSAQVTAGGVVLSWDGMEEPSQDPEISLRYRAYRREQTEAKDPTAAKDVVAAEIPVQQAGRIQVVDQSFIWDKTYIYRVDVVTTVNLGMRPCSNAAGTAADCAEVREVEGDDTPEVTVVARDIFPPAVPTGVQAVYSGEGQKPFIDLIWAPTTDAGLAGYNVYRREDDGPLVKLNGEPVKTPAYRDEAVASGRSYFYSISAIDARGNESARSEETSESVP